MALLVCPDSPASCPHRSLLNSVLPHLGQLSFLDPGTELIQPFASVPTFLPLLSLVNVPGGQWLTQVGNEQIEELGKSEVRNPSLPHCGSFKQACEDLQRAQRTETCHRTTPAPAPHSPASQPWCSIPIHLGVVSL
jgi:hypothetical protein